MQVEGRGNLSVPPLFLGGSPFVYRLQTGSPCIDAGTKVSLSTDLDGNPRPVDVIGVGREGDTAYDMGAYEFQLPVSDINHDGKVNSSDLILFQGEWMKAGAGN